MTNICDSKRKIQEPEGVPTESLMFFASVQLKPTVLNTDDACAFCFENCCRVAKTFSFFWQK